MDERVAMYIKLTGFTPSPFQQDLIETRVVDLKRWNEAIVFWAGNCYRPQSVLKVIEYYDQLALGKPQYGAKPRPSQLDAGRPQTPLSLIDDGFCAFCKRGDCHTHQSKQAA